MDCNLTRFRTFLVDLDGVIYRGNTPMPGARSFFEALAERGMQFCVLTNNATATPAQVAQRLGQMGVVIDESLVITSGELVAYYLRKRCPHGARVYIIGEDGLREPMIRSGFAIDEDSPEYVVVGLDRQFDYNKMSIACLAIRQGAKLIASNPDRTYPTERGLLPGAGALLASIVACTGARPVIIGKPSALMLTLAIDRLQTERERTAIIGDRIDTDVLAGKRAGIATILVLTGVTTINDLARSRIKPDCVFNDLVELQAELEK